MKIVLIGDIHNGTTSESTTHPGVTRLASSQAVERLHSVTKSINALQPDLVVQLGDVIRDSFDKETDKHNFHAVLGELLALEAPIIHVLGNHDVLALEREELSALFLANGLRDVWQGVKILNGIQIVWLDVRLDDSKNAHLPDDSLRLLGELDPDLPTIICSHYSMNQWNPAGNFYTNTNPTWMSYTHTYEALALLDSKNILGFINGHSHWGAYATLLGKPVITCPSFSEYLLSPGETLHNPGVYSILEVNGNHGTFKSFSGDFAFLNFEF